MTYLNKFYTAALLAVSLAVVTPTHALLLNTGDSVFYNFDFTGATSPPPYNSGDSVFELGAVFVGQTIGLVFFDGLNGTGGQLGTGQLTAVGNFPSETIPLPSIP